MQAPPNRDCRLANGLTRLDQCVTRQHTSRQPGVFSQRMVGPKAWSELYHQMESVFKQSDYEGGAVACIRAVTKQLVRRFPGSRQSSNELPDEPVVL